MQISPTEKDFVKIADWTELQALYSDSLDFSFEEVRSTIDVDGTLADEETSESSSHDLSEELVAYTQSEISRRSRIAQGAYPFELSDGILHASLEPQFIPYNFCLLIADRESYISGDQESDKLFEHLVEEAITVYLGGKAICFGTPRDTMAAGIHDALDELADITGNRKLSNGFPTNAVDKDLGLDVVGWNSFSGRQWNKIEVFVQCTTNQDWINKKREPEMSKWSAILNFPFIPIKSLAIPYVLSEAEWERKAYEVLLIDRLRIASVLNGNELPDDEFQWLQWCQERIEVGKLRN